jgi:6-phosphogluconolactonase (cycloisomerase 2 family)
LASGFLATLEPPTKEKFVKRISTLVLIATTIGLGIYGCGVGGSTAPASGSQTAPQTALNPVPTITAVSPSSSTAGGAPFTLTINGTNFIAASTLNFGGMTAIANLFYSSTHLTVPIPAAAIASAGIVAVTVTNPGPGGGTSNVENFTVTSGSNPAPTITSLIPSCAPVGAQSLVVEVIGSNFVSSSVVRWNGSNRPTTVFGGGALTVQIAASDLAATGTASITVFNPAPGGGNSNTVTFTSAAGGVDPVSIAVDPTGKFAYVANGGCPDNFPGNVSMYKIDGTSGALTSIGPPVPADFGPNAITVDPSGKFVYVANDGAIEVTGGSESIYTIDPTTGALTSIGTIQAPCAPPPSPGSCTPYSIAVHPSGKFAYVANEGGFAPTSISMYTINATTGVLGFIGTVSAGGRAVSVTVDPTGKFAYAANSEYSSPGSASVAMYTINATSGALTPTGLVLAGTDPFFVAVDPTGKFAYVSNSGSDDVSMYTIDGTTGTLTFLGTITGGGGPIAIHPSGKFAYVGNSLFAIDRATGFLTFLGTTGIGGSSIAIHPSGMFAYVTNPDSNTVSMYAVDTSSGALTLIGTIGT